MKTITITFLSLVCFLGCTGQKNNLKLKLMRHAAISLPHIKSLKIKNFNIQGRINVHVTDDKVVYQSKGSYQQLAKNNRLTQKLYQKNLEQQLLKNGRFRIVRNDSNYDGMLQGHIYYQIHDKGAWEPILDTQEEILRNYRLERKIKVDVHLRVLSPAGKVFDQANIVFSDSQIGRGKDKFSACQKLSHWSKFAQSAIQKTVPLLMRKIAPYYDVENRILEAVAGSKFITAGNEQALRGNWEDALKYWKYVEDSGSDRERVAALYNQGIYQEMQGRLHTAFSFFVQCQEISGNPKYTEDINRVNLASRVHGSRDLPQISRGNSRIVKKQIKAYNTLDLDRFLSQYDKNAEISYLPSGRVIARGHEEIRLLYQELFKDAPESHRQTLTAIEHGNFTVFKEKFTGFYDGSEHIFLGIYYIKNHRIQKLWLIPQK